MYNYYQSRVTAVYNEKAYFIEEERIQRLTIIEKSEHEVELAREEVKKLNTLIQ